ncbi:MAG: spondin domain-containing protein [Acidobacteriota bacterium]
MRNFRFIAALACLLIAIPAAAVEVELTIETLVPENGVFITPVWVGFHNGQFDSYDGGVSADLFPGLEEIAEDGNTGPISASFNGQVPTGLDTTVAGAAGPLMAGETVTRRFDLSPATHRYFSYVSMVIPSNDAFIANGNPLAHRVFDVDGNFTPLEFYVVAREINDAGTEVNDEIPANVAALGQMAPNTGTPENGVVTDHPGFIEGGAILAARPNGDFTLPGYRIVKFSLNAVPQTVLEFGADAAEEVPTNDSTAIAACSAALNEAETRLSITCEHNVENVAAAHIHEGAVGENGPVVFPFADPTSPFSQTFDVNAAQAEAFINGDYYVNIHSEAFPNGEIRGQLVGCFDGPRGLCLNQERFQVTVEWETPDGTTGRGVAVEGTADSGFFYFFNDDNIELDIKVLNGCDINNYYWVFAAGTTDVGVDITVTDTQAGVVQNYSNPLGQAFAPILDTAAFLTCP